MHDVSDTQWIKTLVKGSIGCLFWQVCVDFHKFQFTKVCHLYTVAVVKYLYKP